MPFVSDGLTNFLLAKLTPPTLCPLAVALTAALWIIDKQMCF
jgi:hypothetical protein